MTAVEIAVRLLRLHEGVRYQPYDDKTGKPLKCPSSGGHVTLGVGHNTDARPLSDAIVNAILMEDIEQVSIPAIKRWLSKPPWVFDYWEKSIIKERKAALICLDHWGGLTRTVRLLEEIRGGTYNRAANEIIWNNGGDHSRGHTTWWKINADRCEELADIIRTGTLPAWVKET